MIYNDSMEIGVIFGNESSIIERKSSELSAFILFTILLFYLFNSKECR